MFFDCLNHYKQNCGIYNRVFKHMKLIYSLFRWVPIIIILELVVVSIYFNIFVALFLGGGIGILLAYIFNKKAKQLLKKIYNINIEEGFWNTNEVCKRFFELDIMTMKEYIDNRGLSDYKIKKLLKKIEVEIPKNKPKFPIIPSFIAALFVALWNSHLQWIFSSGQIKNLNDSFIIFVLYLLAIILIFIIVTLGKSFIRIILEVFYIERYSKIRNLYEIIDIIVDDIVDSQNV
ncbi:MAG: hypothetical protein N4A54_02895 [Peptostreptococcaceae bacterium]|nr:hypothetical protein [Peptostreptococcaceae bacterium]